MALDDLGNDRVDFVWGNVPPQRNYSNEDETDFRLWWELYPGDGEAEYYFGGHATANEFNNYFGQGRMTADYQKPSIQLSGLDSHNIMLRKWNNFPYNEENTGFNLVIPNGWYWSDGTLPGFEFPNIVNLDEADAIKSLADMGIDPKTLVPLEFDAPEEYRYIGYDGSTYYDAINAPGASSPGVIVYQYLAPDYQLGNHWDGSPWYAAESDGKVLYTGPGVSNWVPVDTNSEYSEFPWWHSFLVINTKDPKYNSYLWWD